MLLTAVYGGYFGAAVSIVVLALLAVTVKDTLHRLNAVKVPLAGSMNLVSGIVFAFFAPGALGVRGRCWRRRRWWEDASAPQRHAESLPTRCATRSSSSGLPPPCGCSCRSCEAKRSPGPSSGVTSTT